MDILKTLLAARKSAGEIGKHFKITRNAVIGKVRRSGLHFMNPPPHRNRAEHINLSKRLTILRAVQQKQKQAVIRSTPPTPEHGGLSIYELLPQTCRWPIHDNPYLFCGAEIEYGSPYCAYHTDQAYGRTPK